MKSGVYVILNRMSKKVYIGSSVNIKSRWAQHLHYLNVGRHQNEYLQRAYDKYGRQNFEFYILELTNNLVEREQYWLDKIQPFDSRGYNILKFADRRPKNQKLTDDEIYEIKQRLHKGESQTSLAKKYGVHYSTISLIWNNKLHSNSNELFDNSYYYGLNKPKLTSRGQKNGCSKLTEIQVKEIKQSLALNESVYDIAARYSVGRTTIVAIKTGQNWAWIDLERTSEL